jgi:hypothetical protein
MRNVEDKPLCRALLAPLKAKKHGGGVEEIPIDFEWDGSSAELLYESVPKVKRFFLRLVSAPLNFVMRSVFPRQRHPVASCRHDWRCERANTPEERKWADGEFEKDVGKTSWWITKKAGYVGVRTGALFGVGVHY